MTRLFFESSLGVFFFMFLNYVTCFVGDSYFFTDFFKDFAVKIIAPVHFVSFSHAVELDAMCNFMFKHNREQAKRRQGFC